MLTQITRNEIVCYEGYSLDAPLRGQCTELMKISMAKKESPEQIQVVTKSISDVVIEQDAYKVMVLKAARPEFFSRNQALLKFTVQAPYPVSYTHLDVYKRQL